MRTVAHYTFARYPGGWAAEWYDWATNQQYRGRGHAERLMQMLQATVEFLKANNPP